jgi:hypothetical protein
LCPALTALGFREVLLERCMCPEKLFQSTGAWFGTSWDDRERCLDLRLGKLYWMKDVMPRIIVVGKYRDYSPQLPKEDPKDTAELISRVRSVAESFPRALDYYRRHPELEEKWKQRLRPMIIGEANEQSLEQYYT